MNRITITYYLLSQYPQIVCPIWKHACAGAAGMGGSIYCLGTMQLIRRIACDEMHKYTEG